MNIQHVHYDASRIKRVIGYSPSKTGIQNSFTMSHTNYLSCVSHCFYKEEMRIYKLDITMDRKENRFLSNITKVTGTFIARTGC